MLFIRNRRYSLEFLSGFTRGEYHVIRVDFIYSSRGRLKRDRGFANPLSLSNTSPDPLGIRCGGALLLPRLTGISDSGIRCRFLIPTSIYRLAICVRAVIVRVSVGLLGLGRSFFIIGGRGCSYLRLRGVLLWSIVGITADRAISSNFVWCKPISPIVLVGGIS